MRKMGAQSYNIQSLNTHLLNILEENYYIELGNVDVNIISRLLNGETIFLEKLFYSPILVNGYGKISNEEENDESYQINYLYSLHQRSSSNKFILTCGIVKYRDNLKLEKFAPIVLMPLDINYITRKVCLSGDVTLNSVILRYFKKNNLLPDEKKVEMDNLRNYKIMNVIDIDNVCIAFKNIMGLEVATDNYLTIMEIEYPDFVDNKGLFAVQRSLFETSDYEITKTYINNIKSILPANIIQKYIINKAHQGENFVVDGRLGTGKTYTIINIIADQILNDKKVLYLNQDLNNINDFRRKLKKLGLEKCTYNLTNNIWSIEEEKELDVTRHGDFDASSIEELQEYQNIYNQKFHGYPYSYIIEKLTIEKLKGNDKEIPLEKSLERHEVEHIYKCLKLIEEQLKQVDNFPSNPWSTLLSSKSAPTIPEIIERTKAFYKVEKEIISVLDEFTKKYKFKRIDNIIDFNRLNDEIVSFTNIRPLKIWCNDYFYEKAVVALNEISAFSDRHYNDDNYYKDNCVETYEPGTIAKLLKIITNKHYEIKTHTSEDVKYVDRILSSGEDLNNLSKNAKEWTTSSLTTYESLEKYFSFDNLNEDVFTFLVKYYNLLSKSKVLPDWYQEFLDDPKKIIDKSKEISEKFGDLSKVHKSFIEYIFLDNFKYHEISEIYKNKHPNWHLKKIVDLSGLKRNHRNFTGICKDIQTYYELGTAIKDSMPKYNGNNDEKLWRDYQLFVNFVASLTPWEIKTLSTFVKEEQKNDFSRMKDIIKLLEVNATNYSKVKEFSDSFDYYHIVVGGSNFIELVNSIKDNLNYLDKVIAARDDIISIFKKGDNVTTLDCLILNEVDKDYKDCIKNFDNKSAYYKGLFGKSFNGYDTHVTGIGQTIDHFENFLKRVEKNNVILNILTNESVSVKTQKEYDAFIEYSTTFVNLYNEWYQALRRFSTCFYGGKMSMQNKTFQENLLILEYYVTTMDQVEAVANIEYELDIFYEYGLKDLPKGIQEGRYSKGIASRYIYSTMKKYYDEIHDGGFVDFTIKDFEDKINELHTLEKNLCENNLLNLRDYLNNYQEKRKFNLFIPNLDLENLMPYQRIFIGDITTLNSNLNLNHFDLVIVDDAHLSTANKYNNIINANHVLVFGDCSFQTSITNSLMQRVGYESIVHLYKRYIEMPSLFNNKWEVSNQYIYYPNMKVDVRGFNSIDEMVEEIVDHYKKNKILINIIVDSPITRRKVFSSLVNCLRKDYSVEETLNIINYPLQIISSSGDAARLSDETYIWYPDLINHDEMYDNLLVRNYVIAKESIQLCYLNDKNIHTNEKLETEIEGLIGKNDIRQNVIDGVAKALYDNLVKRGLKPEIGFGHIDVILRNKNKNIGICIIGKRTDGRYSIVDDYLFYVYEYQKRGWEILNYTIDELFKNFNVIINRICNDYDSE